MAAKVTSEEIALLAGVSQSTVSRALRGSPLVQADTRRRIETIARSLNYTVDRNASNLRFQHSNTLALLFFEDPAPDDSLINPFFVSMLGSITRASAKRGYDLLISFQQLAGNWHVTYEDSRKADGIILLGYGDYLAYRARLEQLVEQGTHFVRWGAVLADQPGISIGSDNLMGGYLAAQHLLQHGRRRLAFLGHASSGAPEFMQRYQGFVRAIAEHGSDCAAPMHVDSISDQQAGFAATTQLLQQGAIDGIFAASDLIALGALRALREQSLSVPDDVAVIGFDDIPAASMANPPLTTISQDTRRAGEVLVDTLLQQIRSEPACSTMLPVRLIARASCGRGCPAGSVS